MNIIMFMISHILIIFYFIFIIILDDKILGAHPTFNHIGKEVVASYRPAVIYSGQH